MGCLAGLYFTPLVLNRNGEALTQKALLLAIMIYLKALALTYVTSLEATTFRSLL
jgi:hypothetical protein